MKTCGKCGKDYDGYTVLIEDSILAYSAWIEWKDKYGDFCWECFSEENEVAIARID